MKVEVLGSGLPALVSIPFLAFPAVPASARVADPAPRIRSTATGVPRLETPSAQLAHAAACRTAMRGKAGMPQGSGDESPESSIS